MNPYNLRSKGDRLYSAKKVVHKKKSTQQIINKSTPQQIINKSTPQQIVNESTPQQIINESTSQPFSMNQDQFQSLIQALSAALPKQSKIPKLSLGSDVDMIKVRIESWEQCCESDLADETKRKYLLEQIINSERIFEYLVNTKCIEITKCTSYDDLKNTVIKACSSDAFDLLSKPTKVDPYLALKAANSLFPNASKEDKLNMMKNHLDAQMEMLLMMNSQNAKDVDEKIIAWKKFQAKKDDPECKPKNEPNVEKADQIIDLLKTMIVQKQTNQIQQPPQQPVQQPNTLEMFKEFATVMQVMNGNANSSKKQSQNSFVCYYHSKLGDDSYTCKKGCSKFNPNKYTLLDTRTGNFVDLEKRTRSQNQTKDNTTNSKELSNKDRELLEQVRKLLEPKNSDF